MGEMWKGDPPHPEEGVLRLWLSFSQDPQVRVVSEGQEEEDHRHRQDEAPRPGPQEVPQRIPRADPGRESEEICLNLVLTRTMCFNCFKKCLINLLNSQK